MEVYRDAKEIVREAIDAVLPDQAVRSALEKWEFLDNVYVAAVGKAAWKMAEVTQKLWKDRIKNGIILTKYGCAKHPVEGFEIIEAGHPVPDDHSILGTQKIIDMVKDLTEEDNVIFLLSGGGSSLFELPTKGVTLKDLQSVTKQFLKCGAQITEINTVRKRLSDVKGGKFAACCAPARVYSVILSDVLGDKVDMIASGPVSADQTTCADAVHVVEKYGLKFGKNIVDALHKETPKQVDNVEILVEGSVSEFCAAAAESARRLGYQPYILSDMLDCEAREAGRFMAGIARTIAKRRKDTIEPPCAVIAGGETVVKVLGKGKGGRNQEIALGAAEGIRGLENVVIFSVSSDGSDGPTDAAGGIVDGGTAQRLERMGISCEEVLRENDSYHALQKVDGLIMTGATGTNVNDITVILCK